MRPRVEAIALGHWVAIALGAMSRSSSSGEPQASSSDSEDVAPKILVKKKVARFTTAQKTFMNAYYNQGMKGTGKQYKHLIKRAASEAGLSTAQVKVCI